METFKFGNNLGKKQNLFIKAAVEAYRFLINSNLVTAAAGSSLAYAYYKVTSSVKGVLPYVWLTFLYIFAMHTFNRFIKFNAYKYNSPSRARFFAKAKTVYIILGIFSLITAAVSSFLINIPHLIILILCSLPGILYALPLFPSSFKKILPYRSLREIPGSKDIFIALGWAFIIVLFPAIANPGTFSKTTIPAFIFIFLIVSIRSVLFDILDIPGDRITGNETIPILLGFRKTRKLLGVLLAVSLIMLLLGIGMRIIPIKGMIFSFPILYLGICTIGCSEKAAYYPSLYEGIIDFNFIIIGCAAFLFV